MLCYYELLFFVDELRRIVARPLFFLYQFVLDSTTGLKAVVTDIISTLFCSFEEEMVLSVLKSLAFDPIVKTLKIVNGPSGGLCFSKPSELIE